MVLHARRAQLKENGTRLRRVGARVIAEVFLTQLGIDPNTYLHARRPCIVGRAHTAVRSSPPVTYSHSRSDRRR